MDMSQPAQSMYTPKQPRSAQRSNAVRASLATFGQLESTQVVWAIVLGLLDFATLGVCGGEAQHRRAIRIWNRLLLLGVLTVMGIAVWKLPEVLQLLQQ